MGLNEEIEELKLNVDGLEKERNFYFGKLREIEILVQTQLEVYIYVYANNIDIKI